MTCTSSKVPVFKDDIRLEKAPVLRCGKNRKKGHIRTAYIKIEGNRKVVYLIFFS